MTPQISELMEWARGAGDLLRGGYGKPHDVSLKGRIDLVTEMDHASEDFLLQRIRARYPDHTIFTEESGHLSGSEQGTWYLDPLDGTTNYAHSIPFFGVSIAYAEGGQVKLGVVYEPMRDECFSAERGKGAWLNGNRLQVSSTQDLVESLVVTGFPYALFVDGKTNLEGFAHFTRLTRGVRRLGAAAVDMCYVAAGRFDGYWELTLQAWDMAAGALIVQEAGGKVTNVSGDENFMRPPYSVLAGSPAVHSLMLNEFLKGL
jgi:myo-inositol-1(or 4)-monophosphatase